MARGSVRKRGRVWYAYWHDPDGRQRAKAVSTRRLDAEEYLARVMGDLATGAYVTPSLMPFEDYADYWLKDVAGGYQEPSTLKTNASRVKRLKVLLRGRPLGKITTPELRTLVNSLEVGNTTKGYYLVLLGSMFKTAVDEGRVRVNPARAIKPPKKEHKEMRILTPYEVGQILDSSPDPQSRALFATLAYTGMRLGEALALHRGDIDTEARTIRIHQTLYSGKIKPGAKTKRSVRTVSIPNVLVEELSAFVSSQEARSGLLFSSSTQTPLDGDHVRARAWTQAVDGAKLKGSARPTMHSLRHFYASMMIRAGANPKVIQQALGHSSIVTTMDRYGHLFPDAQRDAADALDALLK